jgi:hypothetical protein
MTPATIILILLGSLAPAAQIREQDGVRIRADVEYHLFTWTVENVSAAPITSFSIDVHNTYGYEAPERWQYDGPTPRGTFRAWANGLPFAIRPGQSGRFAARRNNVGAVLGGGTVTLGLDGGRTVELSEVWRPVPESARTVYLVPLTIGLLAILHVVGNAIYVRRRRITDA